ncbi:MAG: DUF6371 domain-containing protein, partial [Bacteroidetes bacterium]|nr:DUF6371 domain-containing protein [Bacteroidota bacterium]
CNRESNCGHHYTPKQYFQDNNISFDTPKPYKPHPIEPQPKQCSFVSDVIFKASLKDYEANHFLQFLIKLFSIDIASELISRYFIATSKFWKGATIFWQIDTRGKVRTGKIMLYNPTTGKRIKEPFNHINWVHKLLKTQDFELRQCLFGQHLLIDKTKPIAIVESEKTAVIASVYLPQFIWVAVGSLTNLNAEKCSILQGRSVTLFPDLNGFDKWSSKAKELSRLATFTVSDLLERKASEAERKQGFDIADYLIQFDYKQFVISEPTAPAVQLVYEMKTERIELPIKELSANWDQDINELEKYFAEITLPAHPLKLNDYTTIIDCSLFVESHLATVKRNNGKRTFMPYLNRLQELKQVLTTNLN